MNKKISIVLAVYKPNLKWLDLLLESLNNQTYKNINLFVCDDCPESPVNKAIFSEHITKFPYEVYQNKTNVGSNKTFEFLTNIADGEYIAYCDQDDIWEPHKLEYLASEINDSHTVLAFSDMYIIDEYGNIITDSITKIRRRHVFLSGNRLYSQLLVRNFVTGCTTLADSRIAKESIPFPQHMIHDHWIALYASTKGYLKFVNKPLIQYRQHSNNQTSVLMNIKTKKDYCYERIYLPLQNLFDISKRFEPQFVLKNINPLIGWYIARKKWWTSFRLSAAFILIKEIKRNPSTSLFELFAARMPEAIFKIVVSKIQHGKL